MVPQARTISVMATLFDVPSSRIAYIVRTRKIEHIGLCGRVKLFDQKAMARIRHEINTLDARALARKDKSNGTKV